jgi:hypothetical protein
MSQGVGHFSKQTKKTDRVWKESILKNLWPNKGPGEGGVNQINYSVWICSSKKINPLKIYGIF